MQKFKDFILFYTNHFYTIDFLFVFLVIFVFMCLLLVVALLRNHAIIAIFALFLDIAICAGLFYYGYAFLDGKIRTREAEVMAQRYYGGANLSIDLNLTNLSKYDFKYCKVVVKIRPKMDENASKIALLKNHFFPLRRKDKVLENGLLRGEVAWQRVNFEDFGRDKNITTEVKSECF